MLFKSTQIPNYIFQAKSCPYNNSTVSLETGRVVYVFQILWIIKNQIYVSTHQIQRVPTILIEWKNYLELKVWMSKFLDIRSSHPKVSCKKDILKNFVKLLEKYLWCSLELIKLHVKGLQLCWKEHPAYAIS